LLASVVGVGRSQRTPPGVLIPTKSRPAIASSGAARPVWHDLPVATAGVTTDARSVAELTTALFGEALSIDQVVARLELIDISAPRTAEAAKGLWLGSVGYERHKDHIEFACHVRAAGVERLIDVRDLPISRRRGYAKGALGKAMADVGIEYMHIKALGNPKPIRDLYKSGNVEEGQRGYEEHLLGERRGALEGLVPLVREKRCALMCVEHDPSTCHRTVILDALRGELGLNLNVSEIS
jgi:Protein of unknown function, DUF488